MIGHLYTLLFAGETVEQPSLSYGGGGGHDDDLAVRYWQEAERQRHRNNAAAVHLILAIAASGALD